MDLGDKNGPVAREKEVALAPKPRAEGDRPTARQTTSHLPFVRTYSTSTALYLHKVPRFVTRGEDGANGDKLVVWPSVLLAW